MSLLLEALKKAELAKRGSASTSPPNTPVDNQSAASPNLTLETPVATAITEAVPAATTTAAADSELHFPEITFTEQEPRESPPALPEALQEDTGKEPPALAVPAELPESHSPLAEIEEAPPLEMAEKTEPTLSLDFPEPARQADLLANAPEPKTVEKEPAPTVMEQPPAAIPAPTIPVPEYSLQQPPYAPTGSADSLSSNQETAKKILSAKTGGPKRNLKLLGGILIGSMIAGATAAYFYWQSIAQPRNTFHPQTQASQPPIAAPQQPAVAAPQQTAAEPQPAATPPQPVVATAVTETHVPADELPSIPTKPKEPLADQKKSAKPKSATPSAGQNAAPSDTGIKIRREAGETQLDPLLASAYQAFMAGDNGKAEIDYRKALQQTPNNRDALLGLAAIAASRGQADEAASHYLRLLQLDPRDAAAQAGLIGLKGYSDPTLNESRLKALLSQIPDTGYLHFALGNLYAYQSRWPEAQESYFNAVHAEPGNADYAFNLAVALEHLDQRKPALVYYMRALSLPKGRPAGFDPDQLKKRIHELQAN